MYVKPRPASRPAAYPAEAWPLWFVAYAFAHNRRYGLLFLLGLTLPYEGIITPLYYQVRGMGLLNTRWAIILPLIGLFMPFAVFWMRAHFVNLPGELSEAAEMDGANTWQQFRNITLPLLLVAVGPLLVASFAFNFNNFNLIYLFNQGNPPMAGTLTPAGHTDILISYVYNLAFSGSSGINYGFASAITIIIFFVVGAITLFQFRYTRMWEEVSENV